jgi:hypothetical protein
MLYHYLVKYCTPPTTTQQKLAFAWKHPRSIINQKKLIRMEGVDHALIERIAAETEGFSGREIMKMVVAWHDAAFTMDDALLTPQVMENVLHKFHLQHKLKETWTKQEALIFEKLLQSEDIEAGSQKASIESKNDNVKQTEKELLDSIDQDRLRLKNMRSDA